jgi:hypothetical protein
MNPKTKRIRTEGSNPAQGLVEYLRMKGGKNVQDPPNNKYELRTRLETYGFKNRDLEKLLRESPLQCDLS